MTKLITIFGSTGNQGGSVVRAILAHPELSRNWRIRGITRDTSKPASKELAKEGVEMISADLSSKSSVLEAIRGSDAVFGVTNYWEKGTLEHEVMQGKNLADAAKAAGVNHLIWSSLPFVSKVTHGKLHNLHHFDSKAMVEEYIREIGVPASFVMPGYFMSNVPGSIQPSEDGQSYSVNWLFKPDTKIPMLDVPADFGKFVAGCLLHPEKTKSTHVLAASGWVTPRDVTRAVESCTGFKTHYREIPLEMFRGSPELLDNLLMIKDYDYYGPGAHEGVARAHELAGTGVRFSTFEDFLGKIGFGDE